MNASKLKPIYVANYIGKISGSKNIAYTEAQCIYANVGSPSDYIGEYDIGSFSQYDRIILIPIGDKTEFINENSLLWVDTLPNDSKSNNDYTIKRKGDVKNGILQIYCTKVANNMETLYYCNDGVTIYEIKVVFDKKTLTAISPLDMLILIDSSSLVWYSKPTDISSNTRKIRLVERIRETNGYKWRFEAVND